MALTACGVIAPEEIGLFQGDWWMHTSEQIYLQRMLKHAGKVAEGICYRSTETLPGNILLTKAAGSRVWNHGGIVTEWPLIVHAVKPRVCEVDATADPLWAMRQIAVLDPWEKKQKGGESK